jgi:dimethylargininase
MIALTHVPSPHLDRCQLTHLSRAPIDYGRACEQHADYCAALRECGANVVTLDVNREHPDCCFVEDTAIVLDEVAVMMSMGAASRRPEPAGIEPELRKFRQIERVTLPASIDGGDVVRVGGMLFVGLSSRTNTAAVNRLTEIGQRFGYEVAAVRMRDCLHLKSGCTALPDDRLLINPNWVESDDLGGFDLVHVPAEESWAADVLSINGRVCMSAAFPQTAELVRGLGFDVKSIDLSEFAKAEGGVTCMSLVFNA